MKPLESTSPRSSLAAWMQDQGVQLLDLEKSEHVSLVKALLSKGHWWWHDDVGFLDEPIPPQMMTLERAALMLTGWHVVGYEGPVIETAESAVGQTFAAGRNIASAIEILRQKAISVHSNRKANQGFIYSEWHSRSFVDLQTARRVLRKANEAEHFLSEPIERLLRDCAFVADAMPTYAELQAEITRLNEKLRLAKESHQAAVFKRATRMLEGLQAFEEFVRNKRRLSKIGLLDWYDAEVFNHTERPHHLKVPTREELERWVNASPRRGRRRSTVERKCK